MSELINEKAAAGIVSLIPRYIGISFIMFFPIGWSIESGSPAALLFWLLAMFWMGYVTLAHIERRIEQVRQVEPEA
ncbi:hypothetical protein ACLI4Y_16210 [Natrialbaceae archaeon A-CW3]